MNNIDSQFRVLAQRCLNQIGRIDRSSSLSALSSRVGSLKKWTDKFTKAATLESNKMLTEFQEKNGEEKAKAYREKLVQSVQKQIEAYSKKILG